MQAGACFQETAVTGKAGPVSERETRVSVKAASVSDAEFRVAPIGNLLFHQLAVGGCPNLPQVANLRYSRLPVCATTAARAELDPALGSQHLPRRPACSRGEGVQHEQDASCIPRCCDQGLVAVRGVRFLPWLSRPARHTLHMLKRLFHILCAVGCTASAHLPVTAAEIASPNEWMALFNGKNLDGWTPKITGYDLGENFANTFRVENGVLRVAYDGYKEFGGKFGHLFYKESFSNYVLRVEYRFVGQQTKGGPGWALRNSGMMLHCQSPASMRKEQEFPVSIEVQLLGGDGQNPRTTMNLCTPGTHVVMAGQLIKQHCTDSRSKTFHGDQWVTAEVEVHGNEKIIHRVNGETVMEYERSQLDDSDADAKKFIHGGNTMLYGGYISLQAESHPVEFRKVELRRLAE